MIDCSIKTNGLVAMFIGWIACCGMAEVSGATANPPIEPLVRVHWAGTARIASDTNAAALEEIWALPESQALRDQTLDKLAQSPWTLSHEPSVTNAQALLGPLFEDLLRNECDLEVVAATNQPAAYGVAVKLNVDRAAFWKTNLERVVESLGNYDEQSTETNQSVWVLSNRALNGRRADSESGVDAAPKSSRNTLPSYIQIRRSADWTVVATAPNRAALEVLMQRLPATNENRDLRTGMPLQENDGASISNESGSNIWLAATFDLPRLSSAFPWLRLVLDDLPVVDVVVSGNKGKVRTDGTLSFPSPLNLNLRDWQIPTNLIDQPLASFSAIRGIDGLLSRSRYWKKLDAGSEPDQMLVWSYQGQLMQTYFVAHSLQSSDLVSRITARIVPGGVGWLTKDGNAGFRKSLKDEGVEWQGLPYLWPFITTAATNGQTYVFGGAFAPEQIVDPIPIEFYSNALIRSNLVYYGWEKSSQRVSQWLFMGQFVRYVSGLAQMPFKSKGLLWLKAIEPKLADTVTRITRIQPDRFELYRSSSLGFTAIELHLLVDWLESPQFPRGLHTLLAEPPKTQGAAENPPNPPLDRK